MGNCMKIKCCSRSNRTPKSTIQLDVDTESEDEAPSTTAKDASTAVDGSKFKYVEDELSRIKAFNPNAEDIKSKYEDHKRHEDLKHRVSHQVTYSADAIAASETSSMHKGSVVTIKASKKMSSGGNSIKSFVSGSVTPAMRQTSVGSTKKEGSGSSSNETAPSKASRVNSSVGSRASRKLSTLMSVSAFKGRPSSTAGSVSYCSVQSEAGKVYRKRLPIPVEPQQVSLWSILKKNIGKDLSKVTMPIQTCEPLSGLQRLAEYMQYCYLVDMAKMMDNPVSRMEYVCAFAVGAMASQYKRMNKPFNPLLGETFECVRPDMGFRFVTEKVSHHPNVSAFHAEGRGYAFWGSIQPKMKFTGRALEVSPLGTLHLQLKKRGETYSWNYVDSILRNILMGTMWVENKGEVEVKCSSSQLRGVLTFKPCDWSGEHHHVEGYIYDGKVAQRALYGSWVNSLCSASVAEYKRFLGDKSLKAAYTKRKKADKNKLRATNRRSYSSNMSVDSCDYSLPGQRTLWKASPRPAACQQYYMMTRFAMTLNELLPDHVTILPATDSRLREDIRLLENGKMEEAGEEKARLEERQRTDITTAASAGVEHVPKWFVAVGAEEDQAWEFTNSYWDRQWDGCPQRSGSVVQVMCQALSTFQILSGTASLVNTEL